MNDNMQSWYAHVLSHFSCVQLFVTLWTVARQAPLSMGVGCHSLLQGIVPTQGLNSGLLHCRQILYQLSHKGSPGILEWVAFPSPVDLPDSGIEPGSAVLQWILYQLSYQRSLMFP